MRSVGDLKASTIFVRTVRQDLCTIMSSQIASSAFCREKRVLNCGESKKEDNAEVGFGECGAPHLCGPTPRPQEGGVLVTTKLHLQQERVGLEIYCHGDNYCECWVRSWWCMCMDGAEPV